jgi:hypothetical protein
MSKTKFLERFETSGLNVPDHVWDTSIRNDINRGIEDSLSNKRVTGDHLIQAIDSSESKMRIAAASHPKAPYEVIHMALFDRWVFDTRVAAALHPNATKEHLEKALYDSNEWVRQAATANPNYKKFFPNGH